MKIKKPLKNLQSKIHTKYEKLSGLKKTGEKINLDQFKKSESDDDTQKNKRKEEELLKILVKKDAFKNSY